MMIKKILKSFVKQLKVSLISVTVKPVIPLNPGGQRASGYIGRTYINLTSCALMKNICFRMKRTPFFIIKPQVDLIVQFFFDQA